MSELSPRAREVLLGGHALNRPTDADRERVRSALHERMSAALLLAGSSDALRVARPRWTWVTSVIVGAGLVGVAAFLIGRHPPATHRPTHAIAAPSAAPSPALPLASAVELPPPEAPKPSALIAYDSYAVPTRPAEDRLDQEVLLLTRATTYLHSGRPADALKVLGDYQRRFPKGQLTQERRAAKAQALCALGRSSEAQAELSRLGPGSLTAARAMEFCDAHSAVER